HRAPVRARDVQRPEERRGVAAVKRVPLERLALRAAVAGSLALVAWPASAQDTAARFEIGTIGDTTVAFRLGRVGWVRPGMKAVVVDPRRRDALVAGLRVWLVTRDSAVAVVTGQTGALAREHVVVVNPPPTRGYAHRGFWSGV